MNIIAWKDLSSLPPGESEGRSLYDCSVIIQFDHFTDEEHRFALLGIRDKDYGENPIFSQHPWQFLKFGGWDMFNESNEVRRKVMDRIHHHLKAVGWDEEDSPSV